MTYKVEYKNKGQEEWLLWMHVCYKTMAEKIARRIFRDRREIEAVRIVEVV